MSKVWFITGAGRGFGKQFARVALDRGDRVAATARDTSALGDLVGTYSDRVLPISLDVTDRSAVFTAVERAREEFGRLDVVVNNAGYGLFGTVEELTPELLRDQFEVNVFGVLNVTQAVLPILRDQRAGHIVQISSIGGVVAFPNLGGYHASKWALEGLSDSLSQEVAEFGIHVTLVEPGSFATDWAGNSSVTAPPQPQYDAFRTRAAERRANTPTTSVGDPAAAANALLEIVDAQQPPLRVLFGTPAAQIAPAVYQARLTEWENWHATSIQADGH